MPTYRVTKKTFYRANSGGETEAVPVGGTVELPEPVAAGLMNNLALVEPAQPAQPPKPPVEDKKTGGK